MGNLAESIRREICAAVAITSLFTCEVEPVESDGGIGARYQAGNLALMSVGNCHRGCRRALFSLPSSTTERLTNKR